MMCEHCDNEFNITFNGSGGKNRAACFLCIPAGLSKPERNKLRWSLFYKKATEQKVKRGCDYCGYRKCAAALEWHHPLDDKKMAPSDSIKRSWAEYEKETNKCVLLCANCHREEHSVSQVQILPHRPI